MGAAPQDDCTPGDGSTLTDGCSPHSWVQPPKISAPQHLGAPLGDDGGSPGNDGGNPGSAATLLGVQDPRRRFPRNFGGRAGATPMPALAPHHSAHPAPITGAAGSPGEVDTLLSELAGAVDGVLVGLVLHHLHALALLALLVAVLADGVELPHAVLQPQRPPTLPPAPVTARHSPGAEPRCREGKLRHGARGGRP